MRRFLSERQKDRVATGLIRTGGLLVILVVIAIVVNIGTEALPLFASAKQGPVARIETAAPPLLAGSDSRRELLWTLDARGRFQFPEAQLDALTISDDTETLLVAADHEIHGLISAIDEHGIAVVGRIRFTDSWTGDARTTTARWRAIADPVSLGPGDWIGVTANADDDGNHLLVAWDRNGRLVMRWWDSDDEEWSEGSALFQLTAVSSAAVAEGLNIWR